MDLISDFIFILSDHRPSALMHPSWPLSRTLRRGGLRGLAIPLATPGANASKRRLDAVTGRFDAIGIDAGLDGGGTGWVVVKRGERNRQTPAVAHRKGAAGGAVRGEIRSAADRIRDHDWPPTGER